MARSKRAGAFNQGRQCVDHGTSGVNIDRGAIDHDVDSSVLRIEHNGAVVAEIAMEPTGKVGIDPVDVWGQAGLEQGLIADGDTGHLMDDPRQASVDDM